jgi:hypothetical protein
MPLHSGITLPGKRESNLVPTARAGTLITASATIHTKGPYTALIASTSNDAYGVWVDVHGVGVSAAGSDVLVDIAIGAAGSEIIVFPDLDAGNAEGDAARPIGALYYFPAFIPAGSRIAARMQALIASDTAIVNVILDQQLSYSVPTGATLAYGVNAALSRGTSVPRGNAVFGAWTELTASTTRDHRFWQPGIDSLADPTMTGSNGLLVQLGVGAAAGERVIGEWLYTFTGSEQITGPWPPLPVHMPVPAGSRITARAAMGVTEPIGVIAYGTD